MPKNPVVFWELASHDQEKSAEFLDKVFDWDLKMNERQGFYTMDAGEGAPAVDGGVFTLERAKSPFLILYILVDDIAK